MSKNSEQKLDTLKKSYSALRSLDSPENEIVKAYHRKVFNELISQDDIDNIDHENLIKLTLAKSILDHLAQAYAGLDYETLTSEKTFDEFKSYLEDIYKDYNKTDDPTEYFQNIFLNKNINVNGEAIPLWQHPNFTSGNDTNENQSIEYNDLYQNEAFSNQEAEKFLKILSSHEKSKDLKINSSDKQSLPTPKQFSEYFGISESPENTFKNSESIKKIKNYAKFITLVDEVNNDSDNELFDKFHAINNEYLNVHFADTLWKKANEYPLLKQNLNSFISNTRDLRELNKYDLSKFFSSKNDMKELSDLDDDNFDELYEDFKNSIKLVYDKDKSAEISYLYEQFYLHEDKKIQGVTFITHNTQNLINDLLTVKDEAPELGISLGELKQIQEEAKQYPSRLNKNFKSKLSRDKGEMKKLRSSRLKVAKLRAYNAALDLELTNEELASGESDDKIKEIVFERAISSDLDELFLDYQKGSDNKLRKTFNKTTSWFGEKIAGLSALAGLAVPVGFKMATKTTATLAAGPLAAVGLGALFMKPASRRILNWDKLRKHVSKDEMPYDKVALNFTEATRDMTGNYNDSLFNKSENIENEFIKKQQKQLKEFSETISKKADSVLDNDLNIKTLRKSLNRSVVENSDPENINKIALQLKKAITKKITEFYIDEYKKILTDIEEKRKNYSLRLASEYATAFAMTLGLSWISSAALESMDIIENAEASEKTTSNSENPKGGNSPTASKDDVAPSEKIDKSDVLKSKDDIASSLPSKGETSEIIKESSNRIKEVSKSFFDSFLSTPNVQEYSFKVPTNLDLVNTTDKDPGLVQLIRSWSDNKLTVKEALEAAKMVDIKNINLIRDGQEIKFPASMVEYISDKSNISSKELLNRDITQQFIKYNKA